MIVVLCSVVNISSENGPKKNFFLWNYRKVFSISDGGQRITTDMLTEIRAEMENLNFQIENRKCLIENSSVVN